MSGPSQPPDPAQVVERVPLFQRLRTRFLLVVALAVLPVLAMYIVAALEQGVKPAELSGTIQVNTRRPVCTYLRKRQRSAL